MKDLIYQVPMHSNDHLLSLTQILDAIDGHDLRWRLTELEGYSAPGSGLDIVQLEHEVRSAPTGRVFDDSSLRALARSIVQAINCELTGYSAGDQGEQPREIVKIVAFDSSYWEVTVIAGEQHRVNFAALPEARPAGSADLIPSMDSTFRSVAEPRGLRAAWATGKFVDAWESFVEEAISSYWGDLYEFENDLGLRDVLELALRSDQLDAFEAWTELSKRIRAADERFRALLSNGPEVRAGTPWWRERLPPYAGEDFVADAARLYGVQIALD